MSQELRPIEPKLSRLSNRDIAQETASLDGLCQTQAERKGRCRRPTVGEVVANLLEHI